MRSARGSEFGIRIRQPLLGSGSQADRVPGFHGKVSLLQQNPHTVNSFRDRLKMSRKITSSTIRQI